jgi:DNA polymerase III alpha subunit
MSDSRASNKRVFEALAISGAFSSFGFSRKFLVEHGAEYIKASKEFNKIKVDMQDKKERVRLKAMKVREARDEFLKSMSKYPCEEINNMHADELYDKCNLFVKRVSSFKKKADKWTEKTKPAVKEKAHLSVNEVFNVPMGVCEWNDLLCDAISYSTVYKEYEKEMKSAPKTETYEKKKNALKSVFADVSEEEYDKIYIYEEEKKLLGFYASGHPLEDYDDILKQSSSDSIAEVLTDPSFADTKVILSGKITSYMPLYRKKDKAPMCKFTLEDLTGKIDVMCFVKCYQQFSDYIEEGKIVSVMGEIDMELEDNEGEANILGVQLFAEKVDDVQVSDAFYLVVDSIEEFKDILPILRANEGNDSLYVYLEDKGVVKKWGKKVRGSGKLRMEIEDFLKSKKPEEKNSSQEIVFDGGDNIA